MSVRTQGSRGPRLVQHACPRCGSEEIRRLSLIHETGLASKTGNDSPHETVLSKQAAPPVKKPAGMWAGAATVFAVVAVASLTKSEVLAMLAFGSVAIAIGFAAHAMTYNRLVFPRLYEQWAHSFMCNRCGSVFSEWRA